MASIQDVLHEIASRQLGLVTRAQLRDRDVSDDLLKRLAARRILGRVRPGVYAVVGAPDSWERGLLAVVLSVGAPAAASHSGAARLWNFSHRPDERYEITTDRDRRVDLEGVRIHRSCHLLDEDVTTCSGITCTTFERTLCDCTASLSEWQLGRVLDDGLRKGVVSLRRLRDCAERLESGPGRRMSVVRALLDARDESFDPGGSDAELRVLHVVRRAGLPVPVQQYRVEVDGWKYRPDFAWPAYKIFAEYYGLPFHTGPSAVIYDSERVTALAAHGWLPLLFTRSSADREIVERVAAALTSRGVGRIMGA